MEFLMSKPATIQNWLREAMSFYNRSLRDHVDLYPEDPAMFFWRQHKFAPRYAIEARPEDPSPEERQRIKAQVLYWFAKLPEKYDDLANENDFAFVFCYLFATHLLGHIEAVTVWRALAYMTRHWDDFDEMVEVPRQIL